MTVYKLTGFNNLDYDDYILPCTEEHSMEAALVNYALWEAYAIHCGHSEGGRGYCKKSRCEWPLDRRLFNWDLFGSYYKKKYGRFENYLNSDDYVVKYIEDDDYEMCQLYSLLDNFHNYCGIFSRNNNFVILSVGSSYTGLSSLENYNLDKLTEGFAVVINAALNTVDLFSLGEDDGNYWAESRVSYDNLCAQDRGIVCSLVNDIDSSRFWNKDRLIEKLFYGK